MVGFSHSPFPSSTPVRVPPPADPEWSMRSPESRPRVQLQEVKWSVTSRKVRVRCLLMTRPRVVHPSSRATSVQKQQSKSVELRNARKYGY
jgi:hypothetical protein